MELADYLKEARSRGAKNIGLLGTWPMNKVTHHRSVSIVSADYVLRYIGSRTQ